MAEAWCVCGLRYGELGGDGSAGESASRGRGGRASGTPRASSRGLRDVARSGDARDQIDRAAESRRDGDELSGSVTHRPVSVGERRARDASLTPRPHPSNCRAVRLEVFPETSWNARLVGRPRVTRRTVPSGFPCADRESFLSRFLGGEGPRTPPGRSIRFPISRFRVVLEWSLERSLTCSGRSLTRAGRAAMRRRRTDGLRGHPRLRRPLAEACGRASVPNWPPNRGWETGWNAPDGPLGPRPGNPPSERTSEPPRPLRADPEPVLAPLSALHPAKRPTHPAAPPPAPRASTPPRTADSPPPRGSFAPGRS